MPTPKHIQLSRSFSAVIRDWASADELKLINGRNEAETESGICHSHDFFDANDAMVEALDSLDLEVDDIDEAGCELWSRAWDLSRKQKFAEVITAESFSVIRLGGSMRAHSFKIADGSTLLWYPENNTFDGEPTAAIFSADDECWEEPVIWTVAATLYDAVEVFSKHIQEQS